MNVNNPKITSLRKQVKAAVQEIEMAVAFHEVWKPAAYDNDLHIRMGKSYATHAFLVVRMALRREMLLALMRLWDKVSKNIRMEFIARDLRDKALINALVAEKCSDQYWESTLKFDLSQRADEIIKLIEKYIKGGSDHSFLAKLQTLRHERLAHRLTDVIEVTEADLTDVNIESFYQDNLKLVSKLHSLVNRVAYNLDETANVYSDYASNFWIGVRGEQTEGHPNYRTPFSVASLL